MHINFVESIWSIIGFIIGYNLYLPLILLLLSKLRHVFKKGTVKNSLETEFDYAVVVTAYEETTFIPSVVTSLLSQTYQNFIVYVVADKCDVTNLKFDSEKVIVLKPEKVIASNTGSHQFALSHTIRKHTHVTIIDSDNIVHPQYLEKINEKLKVGYFAVQGVRNAKNLDSTYACLDAARDIYYHFYDGKVLYQIGSSATLAGSGMAFDINLYQTFLAENKVSGAGFDKVLQAWLLKKNLIIAFQPHAIVLDQKTTHSNQLVKQRSRWINTWFKYFKYGFNIFGKGIINLSANQLIFGLILLRPPLFIFLILSVIITVINVFIGYHITFWMVGFLSFIMSFFIALISSDTDKRIYASLINIPRFVFLQILSLIKARKANEISVATKHSIEQ